MNIRCVFILLVVFANMCASAQNKYTVEADIERAVKEFFYNISEMNNPVEPIRPESFAAAYQKGINVFKVNDVSLKMSYFLSWYKQHVLESYSVTHQVQIKSIERLTEKNRYKVNAVLHRKIEDDPQKRHIKDEDITLKVVWRGQELNNVSIQSIDWNLRFSFLKPNIVKEYELSLDHTLSYITADGGEWEFTQSSYVKSMEGFDGEERTCIDKQKIGTLYTNVDDIDLRVNGSTFSGYIKPNKQKTSRGYLIIIEQKESGKSVAHCIYQQGRRK